MPGSDLSLFLHYIILHRAVVLVSSKFAGVFGPGRRVPKSYSSSSSSWNQFSKDPETPKAFFNMQRSTTKLCIHIRADIAHRSTVSDFPLIF